MHGLARRASVAVVSLSVLVAVAGCSSTGGGSGSSTGSSPSGSSSSECGTKVAFLLKENKTARWEAFDHPMFKAALAAAAPDAELIYANAEQDSAKQQSQAEAAISNGAQVLVMTPVDSTAAAAIAKMAKGKGIPVIAYDAMILDTPIDYYISFQNKKVGELQGQALVDKLTSDGNGDGQIVMINGSPTDANAAQFKDGAHSVIDASTLKVGLEYDTPDWSPDKAQTEMEQALTSLGKDNIAGVYAANDGTAGGAIAAMKAAGLNPIPPVTGQDAELAAIQRIVAGEQYMTVYKAIKPEATAAANAAAALLCGKTPEGVNGTVNNGAADFPSILLDPVAVTKDNIMDTVVADSFYTVDQICTAEYADACAAAGIK